jgi:hypothetical protein
MSTPHLSGPLRALSGSLLLLVLESARSAWFIPIGFIGLLFLLLPSNVLHVLLLLSLSVVIVPLFLLAPVEPGRVPVLSASR